METNWIILVLVLVLAVILIVLLIIRNLRDKEDVTKFFNSDLDIKDKSKQKK